jgi:hypothetical protein
MIIISFVEMLKISVKLYILLVRKNTIFVKKIQEHSIFDMESSNLLDIYVLKLPLGYYIVAQNM